MGFLSPLFLAGAITAAIPIVLHLLRRDPETRVRFAVVELLRMTPVEQADRRRLHQLLLLAMRVAALVALSIAFARPFFTEGSAAGAAGVTVVALDTSLSLTAPGRFARAQQLARQVVADAPRGEVVGVVTFADHATAVTEPTDDRSVATSAIDAARVGFGGTRYGSALTVAARMLDRRPGRIVLITDLQTVGWNPADRVSLPDTTVVEVQDLGALPPNLSVPAARFTDGRLVASIRSSAAAEQQVPVRLEIDGAVVSDTSVTVPPGGTIDATLSVPTPHGTTARVVIDDPEGVRGDDQRYLGLGAAGAAHVLVVSGDNDPERDALYVSRALASGGPDGTRIELTGVDGTRLSGLDPPAMDAYSAVLLLATRGVDSRGREAMATFVGRGGGVLLAVGPGIDPEVASGSLAGAVTIAPAVPVAGASGGTAGTVRTLAPADVRHPVFRVFASTAATLGLVRFSRIATVSGVACQTIARFTTGEAALLDCALERGRVLVLASDLDGRWNDFPRHATFVPFLHESVRYLMGERARRAEYVVGSAPPGVPDVPGVMLLRGPSGETRQVVVNVDPRESDGARLDEDHFRTAIERVSAIPAEPASGPGPQREDRQQVWRYVLMIVLAVLAVESLLAARTT